MSLVGAPYFHNAVGGTVIEVKGSPVTIAFGVIHNPTAAQAFLQIFDKRASEVTLGTTTPVWSQPVSPGDNDPLEGGIIMRNALSIACTTTPTNSTAAVCYVNLSLC